MNETGHHEEVEIREIGQMGTRNWRVWIVVTFIISLIIGIFIGLAVPPLMSRIETIPEVGIMKNETFIFPVMGSNSVLIETMVKNTGSYPKQNHSIF